MRILLFDIDGTLINTAGAGGAALRQAFCSEFEVAEAGDVPFSGRTDRAIVKSFFQLHGVRNTIANWERLRNAYLLRLPDCLLVRHGRVLPGVADLLETTCDRDDVAVGLLTGNTRHGARIKLEYFDLYRYFAFGGFGDQHVDRGLVAREALEAAQAHVDGRWSAGGVWVIGDTPLDIECGRAIDARVLAVATGLHSPAELAASEPDVLVEDLTDTQQLLAHLLA